MSADQEYLVDRFKWSWEHQKEGKKSQDNSADFPTPDQFVDYKNEFNSIREQASVEAERVEDVILTINGKKYDSSDLLRRGDNYGVLDGESGTIVNVCTKEEFEAAYDAALEAKNEGPSRR